MHEGARARAVQRTSGLAVSRTCSAPALKTSSPTGRAPAALTELLRLTELVGGSAGSSTSSALYSAGDVVEKMVALWRCGG